MSRFNPRQFSMLVAVSLLSVVACFVLLYLGQYAQFGPPPTQLRLEVIVFLGILFATLISPFLSRENTAVTILISLLACAGLAYALTQWSILSPTTQRPLHGSMNLFLSPITALCGYSCSPNCYSRIEYAVAGYQQLYCLHYFGQLHSG